MWAKSDGWSWWSDRRVLEPVRSVPPAVFGLLWCPPLPSAAGQLTRAFGNVSKLVALSSLLVPIRKVAVLDSVGDHVCAHLCAFWVCAHQCA